MKSVSGWDPFPNGDLLNLMIQDPSYPLQFMVQERTLPSGGSKLTVLGLALGSSVCS